MLLLNWPFQKITIRIEDSIFPRRQQPGALSRRYISGEVVESLKNKTQTTFLEEGFLHGKWDVIHSQQKGDVADGLITSFSLQTGSP